MEVMARKDNLTAQFTMKEKHMIKRNMMLKKGKFYTCTNRSTIKGNTQVRGADDN